MPQFRSSKLLRDFIKDSLYNLQQGYFSSQIPLGYLKTPIDFPSLAGRLAYLNAVQRHYLDLQVSWLTPVEIFSPHLGASIANYLTSQHIHNNKHAYTSSRQPPPLSIYEIGGGTGTLARDILTWIKKHRPDMHDTCTYTIIEISPMLAQSQKERVTSHGSMHSRQFHVVRGDALDPGVWGPPSDEPCFVVAMEVFDNLPHDRVERAGAGKGWFEALIREKDSKSSTDISSKTNKGTLLVSPHQEEEKYNTYLDDEHSPVYEEFIRPLEDPLIKRCLHMWLSNQSDAHEASKKLSKTQDILNSMNTHTNMDRIFTFLRKILGASAGESLFLPTGALQLFDTLHATRPNHQIIAADFDLLPETIIEGWNAPLVATTVGGTTQDHSTYLVPPGSADIFFPTDFELSAKLYEEARQRQRRDGTDTRPEDSFEKGVGCREVRYMKAGAFFKEWAPEKMSTCTQDGYDPLLSDYSNTSVLLSSGPAPVKITRRKSRL